MSRCLTPWVTVFCFFFKQKTAYEMRISVWSSDVCSSDLGEAEAAARARDVLTDLYDRIEKGQEVDAGMVDGLIAMSAQPTLAGIIRHDVSDAPTGMIRTRKKTIVPIGRASCRERVCKYV